jgi:hypothetical protein
VTGHLLNARRRAWRRTADLLGVAYRYAAHRRDLLTPARPDIQAHADALVRNLVGHVTVKVDPKPPTPYTGRYKWTGFGYEP